MPTPLWEKGKSANPSGRPKVDPKFAALLKSKQEWALKELIDLAENCSEAAVRLNAIKYLLDRGQGKPAQAVSLSDGEGKPLNISVIISQAK